MTWRPRKAGASRWRYVPAGLVVGTLLINSFPIVAGEPFPAAALPNPLTLDYALSLADEDHPDLQLAQAQIDRARSQLLETESRYGARAYLDVTPEWVDPSTGGGSVNDSRARILLTKPLYDFGRQEALETAANAEVAGRELSFFDARQRRRLDIMARFFDVLLADRRYDVDNEEMARRYVIYDRDHHRHELGQISDVDLLESENNYREALDRRTESEKHQASARALLAAALNRPDQLPSDLAPPVLAWLDQEIPDYRTLLNAALKASPVLAALHKGVEAARAGVQAARAGRLPVLNAEVEAGRYKRPFDSRSDERVGVYLRVPLYQGGEDTAALAQASSVLITREAILRKAEQDMRSTVLDLVQELETLKVRRETARNRVAFRDLYLDRSRALYDMEVQTNLGDALVRLTEAQWKAAKADYDLALAWAKVDALTGNLISLPAEKKTP